MLLHLCNDAFLVYQLYASSSNHAPSYPSDGISFVDGMLAALEPHSQGAYSNYIDSTLMAEEWQRLYFGDHVQRLKGIKAKFDPTDVFKFSEGFYFVWYSSLVVMADITGALHAESAVALLDDF